LSKLGYNIFGFLNQRFLVELLYNKYITNFVLYSGGQTSRILDKGSIEILGPFGLEKLLSSLSKNINNLSTGIVTNYALYILIGFISYLIFYFFILNNINIIVLILISTLIITLNKK
jgi:NADH-ubiquinone oxidoreductase chain 5